MTKFKFIIHNSNEKTKCGLQSFYIYCDTKTACNLHFVLDSTLPPTYFVTFEKNAKEKD